jgi:hypothetical protein
MPVTLLDFSPHNPLRVLDWRWRRVVYLQSNDRPTSRRRDDSWVVRCGRFRKAYKACQTASDYHAVAGMYPGLYWAHELYTNRDMPVTVLAVHALEARLLANQPREAISERMNMSLELIDAYHECFFNVQPYLKNTDYLMFRVLGDAVYRGLRERNYDLLWKLFAIWGGPHVLEAFISSFIDPTQPGGAAAVDGFFAKQVYSSLSMKALVAAKTVPVDQHSATLLIEKYLEQVAIEKKTDGSTAGQQAVIANLGQMMVSLPFSVGGKSSTELGRTRIGINSHESYDNSPVELTGDELLLLGAGRTIDVECEELPPPPKRQLSAPQ